MRKERAKCREIEINECRKGKNRKVLSGKRRVQWNNGGS